MTHVSLFTGIGGIDLAAEWAGFETVLQVERDPYCLKVLAKHWPDVPRITDVKEVTHESVDRPITVVSGGFPCQPFSAAGKREGTSDDRHLWPKMLRIVRELRPLYVVGENVSGLLSIDGGLVFETVCADLERTGYDVLPLHYPAASVGAPHRRDRVFIVAHTKGGRPQREHASTSGIKVDIERIHTELTGGGRERVVADTDEPRPQGRHCAELRECAGEWPTRAGGAYVADSRGGKRNTRAEEQRVLRALQRNGAIDNKADGPSETRGQQHWKFEPAVGRVAHGIPARVDRLRALGNAVVPQQAYPIFATIAQMEEQ